MDDVVMENVTLKSFPIFDVDRIEVLRGPQGTLFGRNTPAGIVKIDTREAEPRNFSAQRLASASAATRPFALEAAVGGAIVPDVLVGARLGAAAAPRRLDRQRLHRR